MGKGDKRSFKGKVFKGSFGKSRPRHQKKPTIGDPPVGRVANAISRPFRRGHVQGSSAPDDMPDVKRVRAKRGTSGASYG